MITKLISFIKRLEIDGWISYQAWAIPVSFEFSKHWVMISFFCFNVSISWYE